MRIIPGGTAIDALIRNTAPGSTDKVCKYIQE